VTVWNRPASAANSQLAVFVRQIGPDQPRTDISTPTTLRLATA